METQPDEEITKIYLSYINTAKSLQKGSMKKALPYSLTGLALLLGGFSSIFWAGYKAMANCIFWGIGLGLVVSTIGLISQTRWQKAEISRISHTKPGFEIFFKQVWKRYWPKQMVTGKKLEEFMELIGRKETG